MDKYIYAVVLVSEKHLNKMAKKCRTTNIDTSSFSRCSVFSMGTSTILAALPLFFLDALHALFLGTFVIRVML